MANTIEYGQGAVNNTIGWGQGAKVGSSFTNTKSILLDGVDDFVQVSNNTDINFTSAFSVSMWINTSSSNVMYPITHGSGSEIKYYIQLFAPIDRIRLFLKENKPKPNLHISKGNGFREIFSQ